MYRSPASPQAWWSLPLADRGVPIRDARRVRPRPRDHPPALSQKSESSKPRFTPWPQKLFEAIEAKITAQAEYVVWRDGRMLTPSERGKLGGRGKKKLTAEQRLALPEADPGQDTIDRWRKKLCREAAPGQ